MNNGIILMNKDNSKPSRVSEAQLDELEKSINLIDKVSKSRQDRMEHLYKVPEATRLIIASLVNLVKEGDYSNGICCCGDSMENHSTYCGHSPVDSGSYYSSKEFEQILEEIKKLDLDEY